MKVLLKDFPSQGKPRERMANQGAGSLSDAELLAIILRSGNSDASVTDLSQQILSYFKGFTGLLEVNLPQLMNFKGIGLAKATSIKACVEIALRIKSGQVGKGHAISSPTDIFNLFKKDLYAKEQELLYLACLDGRNRLTGKELISSGTINETLIHPREVFRKALQCNAVSIILIHNHPSGDTNPSDEDIKTTKRLIRAGIELGIPLLDHIIVYNDAFTSLKSLNLLEIEK